MKHFFRNLSLTALSLALCSGAWGQQVLQPSDNCRDHTASDIVTFADAVLEVGTAHCRKSRGIAIAIEG